MTNCFRRVEGLNRFNRNQDSYCGIPCLDRCQFVSIRGQMKRRSALHFVLIIGIANFFADFTYEGARGVVGPFLGSLGASAAIVGFVAGFGELMGYGLRSISGYFADKSHRHWAFAFT